MEVVEVPLTTPAPPAASPTQTRGRRRSTVRRARRSSPSRTSTARSSTPRPSARRRSEALPRSTAASGVGAGKPPVGGANPIVGGGPVVIAQVNPITLGILAPPGECGVNVAVGEGQPLGNRLDFGGPSFGFFAAREEYLRRMPGRIAGRPPTWTAAAGSYSRCRPASSASAARRRPRTSAPHRLWTRSRASST